MARVCCGNSFHEAVCAQRVETLIRKLLFVTHGCHQSGWRWCPGRCSAGPAALSSPASCSGSTGSSCLGGPGQRLTPAQTRNLAGSERCPVRIPAPGEAHRSEIRAVAPPWHRGGCDHNQVSEERILTVGCTCAPADGRENTLKRQCVCVCVCVRARAGER